MIERTKTFNVDDLDGNPTGWLCTFNDLITLLMVFFVLMFSLSTMNVQDIQSARLSLQSGLGIFEAGDKTSVGIVAPLTTYDIGTATFTKQLEESIETLDFEKGIGITYSDMGIIIALDDSVLFSSGSADINPDAFHVLDKITTTILNQVSNAIRIEGHTDTDPIQTEKYPSNWELSTVRSVNVLKYLIEPGKVLPRRLSAVGYGEAKPLFPNDTVEHKRKNRRVEIVITSDESNQGE